MRRLVQPHQDLYIYIFKCSNVQEIQFPNLVTETIKGQNPISTILQNPSRTTPVKCYNAVLTGKCPVNVLGGHKMKIKADVNRFKKSCNALILHTGCIGSQ